MEGEKGKRRLLTRVEKLLLVIALLIILYFIINSLGINVGTVHDETKMIDPYQGQ